MRLLAIVNKTQFNPVNTRCGTHYTPTHITQSIKLEHHSQNLSVVFTPLTFIGSLLVLDGDSVIDLKEKKWKK